MDTPMNNAPMDKQRMVLISVVVVVVLVAVLGYFLFKTPPQSVVPDIQTPADVATQGVLPSIGEAGNPLTNRPDINPTSRTNPFDSVKTNPFQ